MQCCHHSISACIARIWSELTRIKACSAAWEWQPLCCTISAMPLTTSTDTGCLTFCFCWSSARPRGTVKLEGVIGQIEICRNQAESGHNLIITSLCDITALRTREQYCAKSTEAHLQLGQAQSKLQHPRSSKSASCCHAVTTQTCDN